MVWSHDRADVDRMDLFARRIDASGVPDGWEAELTQGGDSYNRDPAIAIEWPVADPILSAKDAAAPSLSEAIALPQYELTS